MTDEYHHDLPGIFYTSENITSGDDSQWQLEGCECKETCNGRCPCLRGHGAPYFVNSTVKSVSRTFIESDLPVFECNSNCKCGTDCLHRLVQFGPMSGLRAADAGVKGLGLFTDVAITDGSFICEYAGEVISHAEALQRHKLQTAQGWDNYIMCLNEFGANGKATVTFVDPRTFGNIGRYFNHSCEPNCTMLAVRVDSLVPKLCLFALGDIAAGSELTFDYGRPQFSSNADRSARKRCQCGAAACRGLLPYEPIEN